MPNQVEFWTLKEFDEQKQATSEFQIHIERHKLHKTSLSEALDNKDKVRLAKLSKPVSSLRTKRLGLFYKTLKPSARCCTNDELLYARLHMLILFQGLIYIYPVKKVCEPLSPA